LKNTIISSKQNQELFEIQNQKKVLKLVSENGHITIKDLSKKLDLSVTTIITIIDSLMSHGLVKENGFVPTKRGRKPVIYSINENYKYIVAVDLGQTSIYLGISNLLGDFIYITNENVAPEEDYGSFSHYLSHKITEILTDNNINVNELAAIVVGNIGVVDDNTGRISYAAGNAVWESQPIKLFLEEKFPCSVIVKNDINLSTIGEHKKGAAQGESNFAFFRFDIGVKAGIILNNKLYEGSNGAAGEIGFSIVSFDANASLPENRIESRITLNNLYGDVWNKIINNGDSPLLYYCESTEQKLNAKILGEYYLLDNIANKALTEFIIRLGNLIINFTAVMNLSLIILGGEIVDLGNVFLEDLQKYINRNCFFTPRIRYSSIDKYSGLIGAASIGIEEFLKSVSG